MESTMDCLILTKHQDIGFEHVQYVRCCRYCCIYTVIGSTYKYNVEAVSIHSQVTHNRELLRALVMHTATDRAQLFTASKA